MVTQYQYVLFAQTGNHPGFLIVEQRDALEDVIAHTPIELSAVEIVVSETAHFLRHRADGSGMSVDQTLDVLACTMDGRVQGESGRIADVLGRFELIAVKIHFKKVGRRYFGVIESNGLTR